MCDTGVVAALVHVQGRQSMVHTAEVEVWRACGVGEGHRAELQVDCLTTAGKEAERAIETEWNRGNWLHALYILLLKRVQFPNRTTNLSCLACLRSCASDSLTIILATPFLHDLQRRGWRQWKGWRSWVKTKAFATVPFSSHTYK